MRLFGLAFLILAVMIALPCVAGHIPEDTAKVHLESAQSARDTLVAAQTAGGDAEGKSSNWIIQEVADSRELDLEPFARIHLPQFPPVDLFGLTVDLSLTKHVVFLWVAGLLLIILLSIAAKKNASRRVPQGLGNLVEVFIVFIRDDVVLPTIGTEGLRFLPFFLTLFFFILLCNLIGLVPYGSTATGNVSVTGSLAIISFIFTQASGMMKNGVIGYFRGLIPPGVPVFVLPVMIVVEFIGLLTKPFALCIRLFANMTAGHIVILSLISLIFTFKTVLVAPVSVAFALFINLLEIFIAFLQAYIFTILSSLFVSLAVHQEH